MGKNELIQIEVAFATPEKQHILPLEVEEGCTILDAILKSHIQDLFPEIDLNTQSVGIFGKLKLLSDRVSANDRVEIYRSLAMNPMDARRLRAQKLKK